MFDEACYCILASYQWVNTELTSKERKQTMKTMQRMAVVILAVLAAADSWAGNIFAAKSGDWTNTTTWTGGVVPKSGDAVFIDNSRVVTLSNATNNGNTAAVNLGWSGKPGNLVVSDFALLNVGAGIAVGTTGANPSSMVVNNGGSVSVNVASLDCNIANGYAPGNGVTVSGANSTWTGQRSIYVGRGSDTNNFLVVADGAVVSVTSEINVGYGTSSAGNYLLVDSGTVTGTVNVGWNGKASGNYVKIDNGGKLINPGNTRVGQGAGANGNYVLVTGTGSLWRTSGQLMLGSVASAYSNSIVVSNGGFLDSPTGTTTINATNNYILIDGGTWVNGNLIQVGSVANDFGNAVLVRKGGLLQINSRIDVGKSADATSISNTVRIADGGIVQFVGATPAINIYNTGATGNGVTITNGTLSYKGVRFASSVDLLGRNKGATYEGKFTWDGANTLRLNDASVSNTTAYTFAATADPKNYVGLELVEGTTSIAANPVTFGATGSLLISNTVATVSGVCTVNGTLALHASEAAFSSGLTLVAGATLAVGSTNGLSVAVTGGLTVSGAGTLVLPEGLAKNAEFKLFNVSGSVPSAGTLRSWTDAAGKFRLILKNTSEVWIAPQPPKGTMIQFL